MRKPDPAPLSKRASLAGSALDDGPVPVLSSRSSSSNPLDADADATAAGATMRRKKSRSYAPAPADDDDESEGAQADAEFGSGASVRPSAGSLGAFDGRRRSVHAPSATVGGVHRRVEADDVRRHSMAV